MDLRISLLLDYVSASHFFFLYFHSTFAVAPFIVWYLYVVYTPEIPKLSTYSRWQKVKLLDFNHQTFAIYLYIFDI